MNSCVRCRSFAINHHQHGRYGSDGDLCDVCYWRKRAEQPASDAVEALRKALEALRKAMQDRLMFDEAMGAYMAVQAILAAADKEKQK